MFCRLRGLFVLLIAFTSISTSLSLVLAPQAQAGAVELARLLRSPLGRYIIAATPQGAALSQRLIGRAVMTESDLRTLTATLASRESSILAAELEGRLAGIQSELIVRSASIAASNELLLLINSLVSESLTLQGGKQLRFRVARATSPTEATAAEILAAGSSGEAAATGAAESTAPTRIQTGFSRDLTGLRAGEFKANGADFRFADLRDMVAPNAQLSGTQLVLADLSRANFDGLTAFESNFTAVVAEGASLRHASLRNSTWRDAVLTRAQLVGADFSGADLRGADLTGAILQGIGFRTAGDIDVVFRDALFDARTRLPFSREVAERLGMIFVP